MQSRKDTDDVYDRVIYQKGAAILQMLEDWVGPESFQLALRRYLTDHQFGSASSDDLAKALKQESGIDAAPVLFSFLDRSGFPVFHFSLNSSSATLAIEQSDRPWTAPVCFHADGGVRRCEVVSATHAEVSLPAAAAWIWPNAYGSGYYQSLLAPALLKALLRGYGELTEPERLSLASDLENLTGSGELPAADVMPILPRIARDRNAQVAGSAEAIALKLALVTPDKARPQYADWLKRSLGLSPLPPQQGSSVEEFLREKR
jgi:alanyl aminopeptidase